MPFGGDTPQEFKLRLRRIYVLYAAGFILMILFLALAEIMGMARDWIGYIFLLVTVSLYAGIGIFCRTSDQLEYYVAGRRVPAFYNRMATTADCWTGGYVLVVLLLAPYLRKFGQYTIPDFMGARYGGTIPRLAGVVCAVLCSFTYLVAQIYGVGIITTRMTGISFELGIFVAWGACWCVPFWEACARSPGPRWVSTSFWSLLIWFRLSGFLSSTPICLWRPFRQGRSCKK